MIPVFRFFEIITRINAIIDGYENFSLSYEKSNDILNKITEIETALTNIENTIATDLKNKLVGKIKEDTNNGNNHK